MKSNKKKQQPRPESWEDQSTKIAIATKFCNRLTLEAMIALDKIAFADKEINVVNI